MKREEFSMKTNHVMSLVAATVFALGVAGPALAQTPAPAPSTTPAAPSKGDTRGRREDKTDKKDGKAKHTAKKKAAKKSEGDSAAKAPDTKTPEQPKK